METASTLFLGTTVTAYSVSAWLYRRAQLKPSAQLALWAHYALMLGIIVHTALVAGRWLTIGALPVGGLFGSLLLYGWFLVVAYLLIEAWWRLRALASYLLAVAASVLVFALALPHEPRPLPAMLWSVWLPIHVGSAIVAYTLFTLAAILGVVYLLQERRLRRPGPSVVLARLPALTVAERLAYRCVVVGYPLITLTLCSGAIWAEQTWGSAWSWDPKQVMTLITWLVYSTYLRTRSVPAWAGRRSAWLLIGGLTCVLLTFLGVNLSGVTMHDFSQP